MDSFRERDGTIKTRVKVVGALVVALAFFGLLRGARSSEKLSSDWQALQSIADDKLHAAVGCPVCPSSSALSPPDCPPAPACTGRPSSNYGHGSGKTPSPATIAAASAGQFCDVSDDLLDMYGRHSVRLSKAHEGSGYRVQQVLAKARRGENIKVAVLGGSVSEGHGYLNKPNVYGAIPHAQIWHQVVYSYLTSTLGKAKVEFLNGAKAATDSGYFAWCYTAHIGTEPDLVMIELAVNDDFSSASFESTETLLRSILSLPTKPAVILVDSYALVTGRGKAMILNGGDAHSHLAVRYDVPMISLRAAALTSMMAHPELVTPWFNHDSRHIAQPMHAFLGGMVNAYLQEEGCRLDAGGWEKERERWGSDKAHKNLPGLDTLGSVPRNRVTEPWDSKKTHPSAPPVCKLAGPKGSQAELVPLEYTKSWELYDWRYAKYYIQTTTPDAPSIKFLITVLPNSKGDIALGYLRSREYSLGKARCSVAGKSAVLDGYWGASTSLAQTQVIASGVKPGEYEVECKTLPAREQSKGRYTFRIMSLMSV